MPQSIVIYTRESGQEKVKLSYIANHTSTQGTTVVFETDKWIPKEMGVTYYVKVGEKEGQPVEFREIDFAESGAKKAPYTYTGKLGPLWSGYVQKPESSGEESTGQKSK